MITRRDIVVAAIAIFATVTVVALGQTYILGVMHSHVAQWGDMKFIQTKFGKRSDIFNSRTANLDRFECHVTTLNPGEMPHPVHSHAHEELMIIKEGTIEAVLIGRTNRVEAGGIVFCASNELHGLRNAGTNRATYYVLGWYPPGVEKSGAK